MIAVDTNLLVYAHRESSPFHDRESSCVAALAHGSAPWAIPWPYIHEFIAIVTHPRIYKPPTPLVRALEQVDAWLAAPTLVLQPESGTHWPRLRQLAQRARIAGAAAHDCRIAALCIAHGVRELWSADRDFGRYAGSAGLRVLNPLVAA